jgi:hypothetical protein
MTGRTKDKGKILEFKFSTVTSRPGKGRSGSAFGLVNELKSKAWPKLGGKLIEQSYLSGYLTCKHHL